MDLAVSVNSHLLLFVFLITDVEAITTNDFTTELSTERPMSVCMDKAIYHNNDCCFYTNGTYNYDGATMACDSLGGHLIKLVPSDLYVSDNPSDFLIKCSVPFTFLKMCIDRVFFHEFCFFFLQFYSSLK